MVNAYNGPAELVHGYCAEEAEVTRKAKDPVITTTVSLQWDAHRSSGSHEG